MNPHRIDGFLDGIHGSDPDHWENLDYRKGWFAGRAARLRGLI